MNLRLFSSLSIPRLLAIAAAAILLAPPGGFPTPHAEAQLPVTDAVAIAHLGYTEIQNVVRHLEDVAKYIEMVNNEIEQLRRLGDPNTYIGMLGLDKLENEILLVRQGIGQSIAEVQRIANGAQALQYTGNGLYRDISQLPDRFGNRVAYDVNQFKKFDVSAKLADQYVADSDAYNKSMNRLGKQLSDLLSKLNAAPSQIEAEKIMGQINVVSGQMTAQGQILHASADRLSAHNQTVTAMAQRDAEALRQQQQQEADSENSAMLQQLANKYAH